MPSFIGNRGNHVVPSLKTLAAVADGITEDNMQDIPSQLKEETIHLRRRLGVDTFRIPGESLVYIAADIRFSRPLARQAKPDWFRREGKTIFPVNHIFKNASMCSKKGTKQLASIKNFLSSTRTVATTIISCELRCFKFYGSNEGTAVMIMDEEETLQSLCQDGFDMTSVNRLISIDLDMSRPAGIHNYFNWFPNLTSLELNEPDDMEDLVLFKDKLRELRLTVCEIQIYENDGLFLILSQLHRLQSLFVTCHRIYANEPPGNILASLVTLADLRSLTLAGVDGFTHDDVIKFLVADVVYRGKMVERQLLMNDLTLIGMEDFNFDKLYQSKALTQKMKDRIFGDMNYNHSSSALALLTKRNDAESMREILWEGMALFDSVCELETPQPLLLKSLFERAKLMEEEWYHRRPDFELLNTDEKVQRYSPELLSAATAHFVRRLNRRVIAQDTIFLDKNLLLGLVKVLRILDRHLETPPDVPTYLAMLLTIMDYSAIKIDVASLFLRQAKKLPPIDLANFIEDHKKQLTCVAMQLLFACPSKCIHTVPKIPKETKISTRMTEMLAFIDKYTTDFDLKIAIEALLKAANSSGLSSNIQSVSLAERRREEEVERVAAPLLAPRRLYNHLYWRQGHCIKDKVNDSPKKCINCYE